MIKIFAAGEDIQIVENWKETNIVSVSIDAPAEAAALNITTFPCVLDCDGTSVVKVYGETVQGILDIQPDDLAEIIAKSN
jgi:hypothetical protein